MDKLTETAGFGLILGFLWFVWPPLVLLGAGVLLVAYANTRSSSPGRLGLAAGAAWAAARRAYAASREIEEADGKLRRVA